MGPVAIRSKHYKEYAIAGYLLVSSATNILRSTTLTSEARYYGSLRFIWGGELLLKESVVIHDMGETSLSEDSRPTIHTAVWLGKASSTVIILFLCIGHGQKSQC
jgi:hypothetical protein